MSVISNIQIYGLAESIYRSGYPMMSKPPTETEFSNEVSKIEKDIISKNFENIHIKRAISLANAKGGGHNQFLTGIIAQFDLSFTNKAWVEAERYKFLDFVSSMSTMHRIGKIDIDNCCNDYVSEDILNVVNQLKQEYDNVPDYMIAKKKEAYLKLLYNLPSGLIITAGMTTNYRCLQNMFQQRKTHRLPEWREDFCIEIKTFPMAKELITNGE